MDHVALASLGIEHVKLMTTLSRTQIYAMERSDTFPKRILISNTRGVWCRQQVCEWMQRCLDARGQHPTRPSIRINAADRFITKAEVISLVGLSETTFLPEERAGRFPARIKVSSTRVAWLHREVLYWLNTRPRATEIAEPSYLAHRSCHAANSDGLIR